MIQQKKQRRNKVEVQSVVKSAKISEDYLGDEVDDVVLGSDLHGHREISGCVRREEHVDRSLLK